jgi:type IV pilus assembly protein PilM
VARRDVTLYLDDYRVRLLAVQGERVTRWAEAPLEPGWITDGIIQDQAAVAARIRDLLTETDTSPRSVICGISGRRALTRPLRLPKLPETTLTGLVVSEARRVLPVPLEELYISWQTRPAGDGKIIAFVAGIPRDIADSYISTLTQAGVQPRELQLRPLALSHLAEGDIAIIIEAQPGDFDIVVMADGIPQPVRNIPFPAEAITPAERAMLVAEDLKRTIQFYNDNNPETPLDPGLPVQINADPDGAALRRELSGLMDRPVVEINSPFEAPEEFNPSHFVTNLAMVKQQRAPKPKTPGARVRLNVLPEAYRPKRISPVKLVVVPILVLLAVAAAAILWLYLSTGQEITSMQAELKESEALIGVRVAEKQALSQQVKTLEENIAFSVNETESLRGILQRHTELQAAVEADLKLAGSALPDSFIRLHRINYREAVMLLSGEGDSETEVLEYARNLQEKRPDVEVIISSVVFDDQAPVGVSDSTPPPATDNTTPLLRDVVNFTFTLRQR